MDAKPRLGQLHAYGSFSNSLLAQRAGVAVLHGAEGSSPAGLETSHRMTVCLWDCVKKKGAVTFGYS